MLKENIKKWNECMEKYYKFMLFVLLSLIFIFLGYVFYFTITHPLILSYIIEYVIFSWPPITALILIYLLISQKDSISRLIKTIKKINTPFVGINAENNPSYIAIENVPPIKNDIDNKETVKELTSNTESPTTTNSSTINDSELKKYIRLKLLIKEESIDYYIKYIMSSVYGRIVNVSIKNGQPAMTNDLNKIYGFNYNRIFQRIQPQAMNDCWKLVNFINTKINKDEVSLDDLISYDNIADHLLNYVTYIVIMPKFTL